VTTKNRAVRRAVFPVAGFGTRFLPATKAMPKELLPVVDKPLIQYAAEEAVEAGIDTLVFVTGRNKRAIEDHFDANPELEGLLTRRGKAAQAAMVRDILPRGVECIFVRQAEQLGLGHAVLCAERAVGHEPFAVLLADDFLTHDGPGTTRQLVSAFEASGRAQLSAMEIPREDAGKYGMIILGEAPNSVAGLTEKPDPAEAPSTRASIGRYVLTPDVFDTLPPARAARYNSPTPLTFTPGAAPWRPSRSWAGASTAAPRRASSRPRSTSTPAVAGRSTWAMRGGDNGVLRVGQ
jgi:UTP--glucose-1-phosphate uridylyltransferase